jgi:hypothetical protein
MTHTTQPSKHAVRHWQQQRLAEHKPPPTPERIREELGWGMLKDEREAQPLR